MHTKKFVKKPHSVGKAKDEVIPSTSRTKEPREATDLEENTITIPDLQTIDRRKLTSYSSVIGRGKDEPVAIEDLDRLQMELELMLSSVVVRVRTLTTEVNLITLAEESKPKKTASLIVAKPKKTKKQDDNNDHEDSSESSREDPSKHKKLKSIDDSEGDGDIKIDIPLRHQPRRFTPLFPPSVVPISKSDSSNKFWTFVQQYCAEITPDDIKFLDNLVKSYSQYDDEEYLKIPPLGIHYSQKCSDSDKEIKEEASDSSSSCSNKEELTQISQGSLNKTHSVSSSGPSCTALQRLVSALIEECPATRTKREHSDEETDRRTEKSIKRLKKQLESFPGIENEEDSYRILPLLHTPLCFEARVRKELEVFGFIESAEESEDESDEVLYELKKCQNELRSLSSHNRSVFKQLLNKAKREYLRQSIKDDIKELNSEIADVCLKNMSLKLKRKVLSKREADNIWKLLKDREQLLSKLRQL